MNILKRNILKGFAAVAMLCMVGAVFATPVALGDLGGAYYQYYSKDISAANACYKQAFWASVKGTTACIPLMFCGGAGIVAMAGVVTYSTVVL